MGNAKVARLVECWEIQWAAKKDAHLADHWVEPRVGDLAAQKVAETVAGSVAHLAVNLADAKVAMTAAQKAACLVVHWAEHLDIWKAV